MGPAGVRKMVSEAIFDELNNYGFKLTKDGVVRTINGIEQGIRLTGGEFKAGIVVRIELYCQDLQLEEFIKGSGVGIIGTTIATEIHQLDVKMITPQGYWFPRTDRSNKAMQKILDDVKLYCLNYFDRHATTEKIYATLVQDNMWG